MKYFVSHWSPMLRNIPLLCESHPPGSGFFSENLTHPLRADIKKIYSFLNKLQLEPRVSHYFVASIRLIIWGITQYNSYRCPQRMKWRIVRTNVVVEVKVEPKVSVPPTACGLHWQPHCFAPPWPKSFACDLAVPPIKEAEYISPALDICSAIWLALTKAMFVVWLGLLFCTSGTVVRRTSCWSQEEDEKTGSRAKPPQLGLAQISLSLANSQTC